MIHTLSIHKSFIHPKGRIADTSVQSNRQHSIVVLAVVLSHMLFREMGTDAHSRFRSNAITTIVYGKQTQF